MAEEVRLRSVSFTPSVPDTGPAGVMPGTAALVQLKVVPGVSDEGVYMNGVLLHTPAGVSELFRAGVGLTVMVKLCGVPAQPSNNGVTVIVEVTGRVPLLMAVNDGMLPEPLAARPMVALLFVHKKTVAPPVRSVMKLTAVVAVPLHRV